MNHRNRTAALLAVAAGAAAIGAICLVSRNRRAAKAMPRKPEDMSRWENEGGAPRPERAPPPVE